MKRLVIDDIRTFSLPVEETTYCRTILGAKTMLTKEVYDEIWWDHDMGLANGGDTIQLAKYVAENFLQMDAAMIVHTMNPVGRVNLVATLMDYDVRILPPDQMVKYLRSNDG